MSNNTGYHTRLHSDNTVKVTGGSFGGQIGVDLVERLVKSHFTVKIKPSGSGVFVDKQGREVSLYLSVDPLTTSAGKAAKAEFIKQESAKQEEDEEKRTEIENLMNELTVDEILKKLRG